MSGAYHNFVVKRFPVLGTGLAALVESVLGSPLDKRDRISDWDKRPLSENQLKYAALDAYVLIDVFDKLEAMADDSGTKEDFWEVALTLMKNRNKIVKV